MPSESETPAVVSEDRAMVLPPTGEESNTSSLVGTGYRVHLPVFEGPLDLLLHLIRVNEINLFDIPVVEITRQYNETLNLMRELNLEVAGEYLIMAATLLHVKSRMLLPPDPAEAASSPEDPRSELVRQLEEYQCYRTAALVLSEAELEQSRAWVRPPSSVAEFEGEATVVADLFGLLSAFKRILDALNRQEQMALERDRISLLDRIRWVLGKLKEARRIAFASLFAGASSRAELIVTFLALLELIRLRVVRAVQPVRFGDIEVLLMVEPDQIQIDFEGIFDA